MREKYGEQSSRQDKQLSPSSFMRARRPELYSDSVSVEEQGLTKNQLEFHLDTLTQRKEEIRFEHFCRRLAEKELCPNLLPQTGPTGGGDSKADSETYPVAESIAERWYEGDPKRAATERWAFAFSAKAKWKPKVEADVRKIAETERGYTLVYFITNQAVSDRNRSLTEDELRKQWNLDVRILDRTWIVDRIVQNNRWSIVYQTLDVDAPVGRAGAKTGPLDTQREQELAELEKLIEDTERYVGAGWQLFEECIQSALIVRALGKSRMEVDGRFSRALRLAEKHKSDRQRFLAYYHMAWTANWWFDDHAELDRLYDLAEPLALDSDYIWDLDKLGNLLQVGIAWLRVSGSGQREVWDARTTRLREGLVRWAMDAMRPTSALWARTQLLFLDLNASVDNVEQTASILRQMKAVLAEAEGHIDYPADIVARIIEELSEVLDGGDELDEVFEVAVELRAKRVGRGKEGEMRLRRGLQKLSAGKSYDAIRQCAAAQTLLVQEEHRDTFIRAVGATGLAYESAGLLWAARANVIVALDRTMYQYSKNGTIEPLALSLLRKLVWLELQLGRIPCVLGWLSWIAPMMHIVAPPNDMVEDVREEYSLMDTVLGILVLRTGFAEWPKLTWSPALLDKLDLPMSSIAALFSLGDAETLREQIGEEDVEDMNGAMSGWLLQPAAADLPEVSQWATGRVAPMRTVLFGCVIKLVVQNTLSVHLVAEAFLAFLESLLSTSVDRERYPVSFREQLVLEFAVGNAGDVDLPLGHSVVDHECGETSILVSLSDYPAISIVQHEGYQSAMLHLFSQVLEQLQMPSIEKWLPALLGESGTLERAFMAARSVISTCNILGETPKYLASDWANEAEGVLAKVRRTKAWIPDLPTTREVPGKAGQRKETTESGNVGKETLFGIDGFKHRDFRVLSPINQNLWGKARWGACAYIGNPALPPELHLCFQDLDVGEKIFRGWRKRVGETDIEEWIGVTIITGVDRNFPSYYRVVIGVGEKYLSQHTGPTSRFATVARQNDMKPKDRSGLDTFLAEHKRYGGYFLAPSGLQKGSLVPSRNLGDFALFKRQLTVVEAWTIGPDNLIAISLQGVTDPVIPPDANDVPFLRLRERLESRIANE
ncbi:hypothetical protein [Paraburkholderia caribensis]|uniref:hypothetical protein n=1 Tax=Paraburkholderia caribensis TaxID=75105 RepID=UPI000AC611E9|nr:hypothetical protein [Paraburkholderia caribensis]